MTEIEPKSIQYCGVCSWPTEFCEFGVSKKKCQAWLETNIPDLYSTIYASSSSDTTSSSGLPNMSTLSLEKETKLNAELAKKEQKEEMKQEREHLKKLQSKITIKRIERNKRKHIIQISGLEVFEIDTKKLAKTKFATGTSVVKNAEKKDEILIQGDVSDEAKVYIEKLLHEKDLDDVKVEQVDDKIKKKKQ
ncbi:LOW QUALITY PROTEIN: TMA22 Translation machinery-associated protein 22 [Candida maltosa Xu316]